MLRFLTRQPHPLPLIESVFLLGVVGWLDLITGYEATLVVFYAIPILFAVWLCGRNMPFVIAAAACLVWYWADVGNGHLYFSGALQAWEISIRCAFFFGIATAGVAVRDRQLAAASRMQLLEHSRQLEQQINEITEYEQQRIGRELHDGLSQYLAAISCATTSLKIDMQREGLVELTAAAAVIEGLLADSVNQARDLARSLAPVQGDEAGLATALQELAAAVRRRFGIDCTFRCTGQSGIGCNGKATHLYRIAQEAIDNAVIHGKARAVDVRLSANASAVSLSVSDDGIGFSKTTRNVNGIGMSVMRYRANMVDGEFEVEDRPTGGTVVSCTVPVEGSNS
ncbi:MAG: two-component system, LuxR family, sensor kinase FixL [Verrucomicrobiota bacterium]|jgi:signal transduction histidine kinase